ncbi:PREDICTED: cysteine-rich repeat secretory protein 39 [Tarenaya hassleriana]|uniref:cysteine-rich repeat secretory protein 39 n=1 Tax=Tarenaya hassleriana TaxID=28532 RepID=UPI00053C3340|nr:PREDICTED: cysteine-rich repeat secretory protein 39 [Tarenaya hassleriana]
MCVLTQTLALVPLFLSPLAIASPFDYDTLVYKQCETDVNLPSHSEAISLFFHELESKSSRFSFFKTLVGNEASAVSGMFQCRKDYPSDRCRTCVTDLHELSASLCGNATSVRVQIRGCHLKYQTEAVDGNGVEGKIHNHKLLEAAPEHGLIHKTCDGAVAETFAGFEEIRGEALAAAAAGVVDGHGCYADNHELLHVVAQCDGDVGLCDCGECIVAAAAVVEEDCRWSAAGQVYLDGCYVGYTYYPYGLPGSSCHEGKIGSTGKSLAIVVGAAAALVMGAVFLMFLKRLGKKGDDC